MSTRICCISLLLVLLFQHNVSSQIENTSENLKSLELFKELLAIPNDAQFHDDIEKNVEWSEQMFANYGFTTQRIPTETVPLLLANKITSTKPTLLFYFHADGQAVDPQYWFQEDPYQATLKEEVRGEGWVDLPWDTLNSAQSINPDWKIFARSSSDDKGPIAMFFTALDMLSQQNKTLPYNLQVIFDFEEEKGSPRLARAVEENQDLFSASQLVIFDGPRHQSEKPTISFGARGITTISLEVFGPSLPLHSGHYGNYAPNPALRLIQLLASMKDEHGRVTIPHYYDGITLTPEIQKVLNSVPTDERQLQGRLGVGTMDSVGHSYQEALQFPSLNIRGLSSGWVGDEARTIVPATALAEIDIRLVKESDPQRIIALVKQHILDQGYHVIDRKPTREERALYPKICRFTNERAYKAFRTEFDSELGQWLYQTMSDGLEEEVVRLRTMGGSLPISPFVQILKIPAVVVPLVNNDNNQHSPNENLRLGHYFDGINIFKMLLTTPF